MNRKKTSVFHLSSVRTLIRLTTHHTEYVGFSIVREVSTIDRQVHLFHPGDETKPFCFYCDIKESRVDGIDDVSHVEFSKLTMENVERGIVGRNNMVTDMRYGGTVENA